MSLDEWGEIIMLLGGILAAFFGFGDGVKWVRSFNKKGDINE